MSKLSPFRKTNAYVPESPISPYYNENKASDKRRRVQQTNKRYYDQHPKLTQKKRYEQTANINIDHLLEKNQALATQNAELYEMLEERGRIIVALEQKLDQQVRAEMATLEAIQFEKGRFIADSQRRFKQYERRIEQLIEEIYQLSQEKQQGNYLNAQQLQSLHQTLTQEQQAHFHSLTHNQTSHRELAERERSALILLQQREAQMAVMQAEFQAGNDKLKAEVLTLSGQVVHQGHLRKMELSEQKLLYEGMLDSASKEHLKEKEVLIMQHAIEIKRLQNHLAAAESKLALLGEQKKIGEVQQSTREMELIENNSKLEMQVQQAQDFARRTTFQQTQRLKELNRNQLKALQASNQAIITSLKTENARLLALLSTKTAEIQRLLNELATLRAQQAEETTTHDSLVQQLREQMRNMERDRNEEEQRLKVKLAELREADIRALKEFYEHQMEVLNQELFEKGNLASKNRSLLHQELQSKNQMRKNFQIEVLKLTGRVRQLQQRLAEKQTEKRQALQSASDKTFITSELLFRETKQKQRLAQLNEEQKRRLKQLVTTKDQEIEELNAKAALVAKHHQVEIAQKVEQIQLLRKAKEDLETQLKKEKYFYDNELKKKDALLKNNADIYRNDIDSLKQHQRSELQLATNQAATKINALELQLNKYRALEKNLKIEVNNLTQTSQAHLQSKHTELTQEKERLQDQRRDSLQQLESYYKAEIGRLNVEISELQRQLALKEEDLRGMAEKQHKLQQKLEMVMQSQQKLRTMESRIVALGQDNNLVKNIAEMIKTRASK